MLDISAHTNPIYQSRGQNAVDKWWDNCWKDSISNKHKYKDDKAQIQTQT